ncbi:hypothetical protein TVAG_107590 [Trichomonas vaginalis G3]|uniref:Uncharacterized protein n=1 Tax=Trichomonas vaginalis (strain ATCC PRA-98 / G3) TaxID=412133 RepID=A2F0Q5_TRIV3|nr:histone-lysine N-methyltransferase family [Trichomonas vaginalis G3]EAY01500.1 hypothetical protein TVAG_107590 [Trichomonas vaginalis G3]KAI5482195.1 histone-lysine N-methyltransferase family [Trichomonas vaginalis G3]|eukprot:XP_001314185.1 hypothetical protein [Trichomonas vaginalis G3]
MSQELTQNFEYIAANIKDYIDENKLFDTFEVEDIEKIMKFANFTTNDFTTLLKQSQPTVDANTLYMCIRNTHITLHNYEDVISILKSIKNYLKLALLDGVIDFLIQSQKDGSNSSEEIQKLQKELKTIQDQKQQNDNDIELLKSQVSQISEERNMLKRINKIIVDQNIPKRFLKEIEKLKSSDDFERVYKFFDGHSSKENEIVIYKACEEGLWEKTLEICYWQEPENVLQVACDRGNLRLVESLIECGCDKEIKGFKLKETPLMHATQNNNLEVVKYLVSIGANKEAKDRGGETPLLLASKEGFLDIVQYLVLAGADIEAKDNGECTPFLLASYFDHLDIVKYLLSVGSNKEAKDRDGNTAVQIAGIKVREYLMGGN